MYVTLRSPKVALFILTAIMRQELLTQTDLQ